MKFIRLTLLLSVFSSLSGNAFSEEGYSSPTLSSPAAIYYRMFTLYTHPIACEKSPKVSSIRLEMPMPALYVGDRIHHADQNSDNVSDFIIEAFDERGDFLPSVPVRIYIYSVGLTREYDPMFLHKDASMNYWEAIKPGKIAVLASWACGKSGTPSIQDEVILNVLADN